MDSPNHACGCEVGIDCTKTTMCYVQTVEQDLKDECVNELMGQKTSLDAYYDARIETAYRAGFYDGQGNIVESNPHSADYGYERYTKDNA